MRIVIFSAYYWPEYSGTAPYITAPAEYLAGRGHDVHVLAAYPHYPQWRELEPRHFRSRLIRGGVTIHRRWNSIPKHQSAAQRLVYEASMLGFGATGLAELPRPDVYVGVSPALASATLAITAGRLFRRPVGLIFHDLMGRGARQSGISTGRVSLVLESAERRLFCAADRSLVLTDGFRDVFVAEGVAPERIDVAPPWTLRWVDGVSRAEARRSLGWTDQDFVCLHAGNMGQKQGLANVVDAAAALGNDGGPPLQIIFLGDGNDRVALEARAAERGVRNLRFIGGVPNDEHDEMLVAADLLILNQRPSVADMSLPSKLSAYFAARRPVVAAIAEQSAAAAVMRQAAAGPIVDPSDPQALADAIRSLQAETQRARDALGENGHQYARSHLSADAVLPAYERFVKSLAGGAES